MYDIHPGLLMLNFEASGFLAAVIPPKQEGFEHRVHKQAAYHELDFVIGALWNNHIKSRILEV